MLRWLVVSLLLCNLVYFFGVKREIVGVTTGGEIEAEGARLRLSSEEVGGAQAPSATPAGVASPPPQICHMIGPFKEKISARQIKDRLKAVDVEVKTYQVQIPEKPDYWVHLGPMRSRREALDTLRELQAKKIDSFLITEGELVNGVSLGFFTKEELAQAVQRQRREQGYDAKIRKVPRNSLQLWEVMDAEQYSRFSDALWQKVKAGTEGVELRKNSCDLIASAERLD
jgi:hypothetical protein